jgi:hypothetical protein
MLCERRKSRAAVLRRREQTRSSSANDNEVGGDRARCASRARVLVVATKYDSTLDARRGRRTRRLNVMRAEPIDKLRTAPVEALQECTLRQAQGASRVPPQ